MIVEITLYVSYFLFWLVGLFKVFFSLCSFTDVEFDLEIIFYMKTLCHSEFPLVL